MRSFELLLGLALLAGCGGEETATYPNQEIRLLVPFPAGGPTDLTARAYGSFLERDLGRPVRVENLPGGSGASATLELTQAEPDGYTVALVTAGTTVLTPLVNDVGYTPDDVAPIGVLAEVPSLLTVETHSPLRDINAFVAAARARPGGLTVAVPGATTPQAVELQRLREEYGVDVTAVPFNGNSEMTAALLGGDVDAVLINASQDVTAHISAGRFRPLAASTDQRLDWLPRVPTLAESGFAGLTLAGSTYGLAGPSGVPSSVLARLEDALRRAHDDPQVVANVGERYLGARFRGAADMQAVLDRTRSVYEPMLVGS